MNSIICVIDTCSIDFLTVEFDRNLNYEFSAGYGIAAISLQFCRSNVLFIVKTGYFDCFSIYCNSNSLWGFTRLLKGEASFFIVACCFNILYCNVVFICSLRQNKILGQRIAENRVRSWIRCQATDFLINLFKDSIQLFRIFGSEIIVAFWLRLICIIITGPKNVEISSRSKPASIVTISCCFRVIRGHGVHIVVGIIIRVWIGATENTDCVDGCAIIFDFLCGIDRSSCDFIFKRPSGCWITIGKNNDDFLSSRSCASKHIVCLVKAKIHSGSAVRAEVINCIV